MSTILEGITIEDKVRELCQFVVEDSQFVEGREKITTFLADDDAQALYRAVHDKGHALHQMQNEGAQPSESDISEFEGLKEAAVANAVTAAFMDAEGEMNEIFGTVTKYLQKTLQTGEVPTAAEFEDSECCNEGGCGCH
jgi:cell fate (sporulation/competence/biofilm development) regulator YlbF (YheA/YmcA/DUF963 family)